MAIEHNNWEEKRQLAMPVGLPKVNGGDFAQYDALLKTVFSKEEVEAFYARFLARNPLEEILSRIA